MSNSIVPLNQVSNDKDELFYDPDFMLVLERNLANLIKTATVMPVERVTCMRYIGNFDGLLIELGLPHDYIWLIMRMNDMRNCYEFDGKKDFILTPESSTLGHIRSLAGQIQTMF